MKQFLVFVRKEFFHVFRDRRTLLILFGLPVVQILLFGFTLTTEIKNAKIMIMDYSKDAATQQIITDVAASSYFTVEKAAVSTDEMYKAFREGRIKCALVFPAHFNDDLLHANKAQVQIIADASDPNTAKTLTNYLTSIIGAYQSRLNATTPASYDIQPELRM